MKSDGLTKILLSAFLFALVLYVASFAWIQKKREFKGPWAVAFLSDGVARPFIVINQPHLNITNCRISFPDEHIGRIGLIREIAYDIPKTNAPFGTVIFQDPTFLPGTLTFNFFGHEVELMPRTLVVDKKEVPWRSNTNIVIHGPGEFEAKPVK